MNVPPFHYRILIVDDDAVVCELAQEIFPTYGYEVRCAEDGFEALALLRAAPVDLLIADLNMPRMSGFELLSVVRRRFPQVAVIATSGEFSGPAIPNGVLADIFLEKGSYTPREMLIEIEKLLERSPLRPSPAKSAPAPLWIPLNDRNYYVLTCPNCLRSFPLPANDLPPGKQEQRAECDFCGSTVPYFLDVDVIEKVRSKLKKSRYS